MSHPSEQATVASIRRSSNPGLATAAVPGSAAPTATAHYPSGIPKESQLGLEAIKQELRHTTAALKSKSKELYQKGESSNLVQLIKSKVPKSVSFEISDKRNYLLEGIVAIQKLATPAYGAFTRLSSTEQALILVLSIVLLWLPALVALFTMVPAVAFGCAMFYFYFFDLGVLKKHLNEALIELTGSNYKQLHAKGIEFSKALASEALYHVYNLTSGNGASQLKQSGQRAVAVLASLAVIGLTALITLLARVQSFVIGAAPHPPAPACSSRAAAAKAQ